MNKTARQIKDVFSGENGMLNPNGVPAEMTANIGRLVRFKQEENQGTIHKELHIVVGVQRIYTGDFAYRVELADGTDNFGRPMTLDYVIWEK